jgi:hypothetical protein
MTDLAVLALITAFWDCNIDYLQGRITAQEMQPCQEIGEQVKQQLFQNDFAAYVQWWQQNRDREFQLRLKPSPGDPGPDAIVDIK